MKKKSLLFLILSFLCIGLVSGCGEEKFSITTEVEEPPKKEKVLGTVVNCPRLRVREHPSINAVVAAEIDEGSEVVINEDKSTEEFYSVVTATGLEGYCMKDYIQVK